MKGLLSMGPTLFIFSLIPPLKIYLFSLGSFGGSGCILFFLKWGANLGVVGPSIYLFLSSA